MTRPSHLRLDHPNYTWRTVQTTKLLFNSPLRPPVTLFILGPNILLSTLFSNTLSLCSSLNVRDQVSHPHRTTGKILHSQMFTFLESRREDRRFWTEWLQALPEFTLLLISSKIKFWFVTVVPKHTNCETLSSSLLVIFMCRYWPAFWWRDSSVYF
jgi:hypothetical protein